MESLRAASPAPFQPSSESLITSSGRRFRLDTAETILSELLGPCDCAKAENPTNKTNKKKIVFIRQSFGVNGTRSPFGGNLGPDRLAPDWLSQFIEGSLADETKKSTRPSCDQSHPKLLGALTFAPILLAKYCAKGT